MLSGEPGRWQRRGSSALYSRDRELVRASAVDDGDAWLRAGSGLARDPKSFTPTRIAGCVLWLRADLGVTTGGTFTWADQSGTGDPNKNCSSTGTAMPTANPSNAAYGHRPTIDFNGTTNHLQSGVWAVPVAQPFTQFIVAHSPGNTTTNLYVLSDAVGNFGLFDNVGAIAEFAGLGTQTATGSFNSPTVLGTTFTGPTSAMYANSHTGNGNGTNPGTSGFAKMTIGDYGASMGTSFQWGKFGTASVAEVITYNSALSAGNITTVMQYLGARYGIAIA